MRHITLRNRIKRIEKRRAFRRYRPPVIYTIYDAGEPIGLAAPGGSVSRQWGEALDTLASRATAALATRFLYASYPSEPDPSNSSL